MIKEFAVIVDVVEDDFCGLDLSAAISDGIENIGNHSLTDVVFCGEFPKLNIVKEMEYLSATEAYVEIQWTDENGKIITLKGTVDEVKE